MKKNYYYKFLYTISGMLILGFFVRVFFDMYIPLNEEESFNLLIIERCLVFLVPSVITGVLGCYIHKKERNLKNNE